MPSVRPVPVRFTPPRTETKPITAGLDEVMAAWSSVRPPRAGAGHIGLVMIFRAIVRHSVRQARSLNSGPGVMAHSVPPPGGEGGGGRGLEGP